MPCEIQNMNMTNSHFFRDDEQASSWIPLRNAGEAWSADRSRRYARHSVFYRRLSHYFFEFDIYDKQIGAFLDLEQRLRLLGGTGIETVPIVHTGVLKRSELEGLIGPSEFDSQFDNPLNNQTDNLMEGVYLRTEANGVVTGRAKFARPEFVEKIKQSTHWQHQEMVPNGLADGVDIWS